MRKNKKILVIQHIVVMLFEVVDIYASIFSKKSIPPTTPYYAEEAFKIDEWEDVERLEKEVISFVPAESFLPKAYSMNKDKLKRVMNQLDKIRGEYFPKGISLPVGSTVTFPFSYRAPHLLKESGCFF